MVRIVERREGVCIMCITLYAPHTKKSTQNAKKTAVFGSFGNKNTKTGNQVLSKHRFEYKLIIDYNFVLRNQNNSSAGDEYDV